VGDSWEDDFDRDLEGVDVDELSPQTPPADKQPKAYDACNKTIWKRHTKGPFARPEPILITVWNGNPGDGAGGTADAVRAWRNAGYPVDVIDLSKL
jgi:hypothetical protein